MKVRRTAAAFDDWSATYEGEADEMIRSRGYTYEQLARRIGTLLNVGPQSRILEVGTGPGNLGRHVREATHAAICGLDISIGMARHAVAKNVYTSVSCADAAALPVRTAAFDGLYSAFVLHSVFRQQRAFAELYRVLQPGAKAVVIDLFPHHRRVLAMIMGLATSIRREHGALARYQPLSAYCAMAREAGFDVIDAWQLGEQRRYTHYGITLRRPT